MNTFDVQPSPSLQKTNSYDSEAPPNLISFMLKSWKATGAKKTQPLKNVKTFQQRRKAVALQFKGQALFLSSGHLKVRSNDTYYPFRPCSDFFYLTGNREPDCVLALFHDGKRHQEVLFVEPNPGKTDQTFFTDRIKGELWEGARLGVPESRDLYGIEDCRPLSELESFVKASIGSTRQGVRVRRGSSEALESMLGWGLEDSLEQKRKDQELAVFMSEMRLIKDNSEIAELSSVIRATKRGFEDVIRRLKTASSERELEGVFYTRARMEGNDVGYGSIVASGAHGCTLHWKRNDGKLKPRDLLLLDAGIEGNSFYTADITRTFPIGGKFSREQREIYELVHAAQVAAFKEVKPGRDFMAPNRAAMRVLAEGLEELGILPGSAKEALEEQNQFYRRYSLHNVSHMLGLDVHDCAQARKESYKLGHLRPGMVLTVEPGLYFQVDDLTVPARYRGIGIRIEDDVVVTEKGMRNLSGVIPSRPDEVEKWMKSLWKKG